MCVRRVNRCGTRGIVLICLGITTFALVLTYWRPHMSPDHSKYGLNILFGVNQKTLDVKETRFVNWSSTNQKLVRRTPVNDTEDDTSQTTSPNQTIHTRGRFSRDNDINAALGRWTSTNFDQPEVTTQMNLGREITWTSKINKIPKIVIILAYMHTGSTYTARLIKNHPGTFYEYEPLRSLQDSSRMRRYIQFLNGTIRQLKGEVVDTDVGAEAVNNLITCKHDQLDIGTLSSENRNEMANIDSRDYMTCLGPKRYISSRTLKKDVRRRKEMVYRLRQKYKPPVLYKTKLKQDQRTIYKDFNDRNLYEYDRYSRQDGTGNESSGQNLEMNRLPTKDHLQLQSSFALKKDIKSCLPLLVNKCKEADVRLTKFIRMTMEMAGRVLNENNNVRIIHLLRDPRAMMDSQLRRNDMNVKHFPYFVRRTKYMCSRMHNDLSLSKTLKEIYPDSIFTLRYEDLTDDPMDTGQRIFDFIGVRYTSKDKQFMKETSVELEKNATYRANVWRHHIPQKHLGVVNTYCQKLYKELGYINLRSVSDVRNLDIADHIQNFQPDVLRS